FISFNYELRSYVFQAWGEFIYNLFHNIKSYQFNTKHMKLFLAPFLLDNIWRNEEITYQKCDVGVRDESNSLLMRYKCIPCVKIGYELLVCLLIPVSHSSLFHRRCPSHVDISLTDVGRDDFICDYILHYLFDIIYDLSPNLDEQHFLKSEIVFFKF
ncbi:unnamed protein product, partial [Didymodactylos carnosus]